MQAGKTPRLCGHPVAVILLLCGLLHAMASSAADYNGFDVEGALIPVDKIFQGGPPRDGIPAIDQPRFVTAAEADYLQPDSRLIGIDIDGVASAYPLAILNWHEVVNDRTAGQGVVVTFCPLCGTGVVYRADTEGRALNFGVSGLLYNSDVLLYDRQTESLWSQLMHQAVAGPMKGTRLTMVPSMHTRWDVWREMHPQTRVLSTETGFRRDYNRNPYAGYDSSPGLYFPVAFLSQRYHPKERVLGLQYKGRIKAYPFVELAKAGDRGRITDRVAGELLRVEYDAPRRSGQVFGPDGEALAVVSAFWFAWYAFHPETEIYHHPADQ